MISFNTSQAGPELDYSLGRMYLSSNNTLIPIYSVTKGTLYEKDGQKVFIYRGVNAQSTDLEDASKRYGDLISCFLNGYFNFHGKTFILPRHNHPYLVTYGFIGKYPENNADPVESLAVLCVKSTEINTKFDKVNIDYSKLVLVISSKLLREDYKSLYSRLNKEIILPLLELGIEIIISHNVDSYMFKEYTDHIPKFKSIKEMSEYSQELNKLVYGKH